ncbi:beta-glucosidase [Brachybacterium endophyticum]|uniref:Beta-glucosidase n=1 Tax=Brachybacterium endophyticum TaxID=2182385 RepID=A0A2U2RL01_9MICO|nr:glycoside hydrolase family 3 N-terminal domain-containing protein [Brachybacterium endophyticum]PWH06558.1 beta-glucosidase [Brachybacterium endophyticum]
MSAADGRDGRDGRYGWDRDVLALLMAPIEGTTLPEWADEALDAGLGSIILFGYNTPDARTAAGLAGSIHERADQVLVAIDEEGGDVTRLQADTGSSLPSAWALGTIDDTSLTARAGEALGDLMAACDMDLALAPVLDVSTDPANPVIGTRSYGDDPDLVARHGRAFASGLHAAGLGVTAKHFPGHGATSVDSHTALPRIDLDPDEMRREHLAPFHIAPWLDAVMTAHILVPALGEGPATLSAWSTRLLDEVAGGGFHGLVITDALDMAAVSTGPGFPEAVVRAVEAGAHLLCLGTSLRRDAEQLLREAHDAIVGALASGRLRREDVAARAAHTRASIHALRMRRGVEPRRDVITAIRALDELGAAAARRAVSAQHSALGGGPVVLVDARIRADHASGSRSPHLLTALRERGIDAEWAHYPGDLTTGSEVLVLTRLPRADAEESARLREVLQARPDAIVVHTGVPDAAPDHRALVRTLGGSLTMMRAAVELLLAEGRESR